MSNANTKIVDEWGAFSAIPNEFIDAAGDLSDQGRWLFVLLRRYTNGQTGKAFPSYRVIQDRTGWTPKTIAKAVRELEEAGWIEREKTYNGPTNYILKRNRHFPEGSKPLPVGKRSTSHREAEALPTGKSNKTDVNRLNKQTEVKSVSAREAVVISQETTAARPHTPQGIDPVAIALEVFPAMPIYHQETIDNAGITQSHLWRKAVEDWKTNRYSTRNITGLVDSYYRLEKQESRDKEYQNGQNGISNRTTTRTTAGERKAGEYLALQRKLGADASNDPDYKPLPGFEWLESIR